MKNTIYLAVLSLAATLVVAHPANSAQPEARAAAQFLGPTAVPIPHRTTIGAIQEQSSSKLEARQNRQIPFQFCPEFFGRPPKACDQCGGDSQVPGQCDRILVSGEQPFSCKPGGDGCVGYYCQCTPNAPPDNDPKVTMTTVINGETGTVVWEPMTLSQYSNLRSKTTVTLTELATSTSSDELETVVAAVFAGGVAWWVASQSGAIGAALAIPPPEAAPEGSKEDDKVCKSNPKEECKDCGGADAVGLCKSGSEAGCPCDVVQHCPNQPPKCSDPQCGGDNGQSQCKAEGEINGCVCCPDSPAECSDTDCNGDPNGVCQADKGKGCSCEWFFDGADAIADTPDPALPDQKLLSSAAANVFTKVWSNNLSSVDGWLPPPDQQTCDIVTTTSSESQTMWYGPPTQTYCECQKTIIAGLNYFTSGSSTTSVCANGQKGPDGWTQIPADAAGPITSSSASPSPTTTQPPPTTTEAPTTTTTTTTTKCNYGWCGAPFCDPVCGPK